MSTPRRQTSRWGVDKSQIEFRPISNSSVRIQSEAFLRASDRDRHPPNLFASKASPSPTRLTGSEECALTCCPRQHTRKGSLAARVTRERFAVPVAESESGMKRAQLFSVGVTPVVLEKGLAARNKSTPPRYLLQPINQTRRTS